MKYQGLINGLFKSLLFLAVCLSNTQVSYADKWVWDGFPPVTSSGRTDEQVTGDTATFRLINVDDGINRVDLVGTILSTTATVNWLLGDGDGLVRVHNEGSGTTVIQWEVFTADTNSPFLADFNVVISDLDGLRSETIIVNNSEVASTQLSETTNIAVIDNGEQTSFTGTQDIDTENDAIFIAYRSVSAFTLTYENFLLDDVARSKAGYSHDFNSTLAFIKPVPTPTPTPVSSPTPTPTSSPMPTPVLSPTPTPTSSPMPTPVSSPTPTPILSPTPTPISTPIIVATPFPDGSQSDGLPVDEDSKRLRSAVRGAGSMEVIFLVFAGFLLLFRQGYRY